MQSSSTAGFSSRTFLLPAQAPGVRPGPLSLLLAALLAVVGGIVVLAGVTLPTTAENTTLVLEQPDPPISSARRVPLDPALISENLDARPSAAVIAAVEPSAPLPAGEQGAATSAGAALALDPPAWAPILTATLAEVVVAGAPLYAAPDEAASMETTLPIGAPLTALPRDDTPPGWWYVSGEWHEGWVLTMLVRPSDALPR